MKFVILFLLLSISAFAQTYTTNFPISENPISENGNWINGQVVGLDWNNVQTVTGQAFGNPSPHLPQYTDPTAVLTGIWGSDQTTQATVFSINQTNTLYQEVELRLRTVISPHSITGYEINFRCLKTSEAYMGIVRWNGPLGNFTSLGQVSGSQYGVQTGDIVKATIVGNLITAYINNVQVIQVIDSTYIGGSPGIGFNYGAGSTNSDFGFTNFTASGNGIPDNTAPSNPTNLQVQ